MERLADRPEEEPRALLPRRTAESTASRRGAERRTSLLVERKAQERSRESRDIAWLHEEPVPLVLGEVRQVPGPPADDREPERHRLTPHGSVRLAVRGKDENVGGLVQRRDLAGRPAPVDDDAAAKVLLGEASADT